VPSSGAVEETAAPLAPPGVFRAEGERVLQLAIYPTEPLSTEARDDLVARAQKRLPGVSVVTSLAGPAPSGSTLVVLQPSIEELPPPVGEQLTFFARGLSAESRARVESSRGVLMLGLRLRSDPGLSRLRAMRALVAEIARERGGFIWTQSARLLFSPDAWVERDAAWEGDLPDVRKHVSIHYYESAGRHRAVTLGLEQFGVPDLVIQDVPPHLADAAGLLINACAQLLIEGASTDEGGHLEVDLDAIRHRGLREFSKSIQLAGARGRARIRLVSTRPEEGDPDNRLAELVFDDHEGESAPERQSSALTDLVGLEPANTVAVLTDDPELAAVKKKAQARLPELQARMKAGELLGQLAVKGPFPTDDGSVEWMWIEVLGWRGGAVVGSLMNTPLAISNLKLGARVSIPEEDVSDYVIRRPDGGTEGGESQEILQRRQSRR
jgi:uncharacterized protein YegJ (DUF2314 family)